jgi:xylulokinase
MIITDPNVSDLFVGVDVGTTGARAAAFDLDGRLLHEARESYETSATREGWAEQDPTDWRDAAVVALAGLARQIHRPERILAIGLTGQTPTVAPFDRAMRPVGAGMLYRDNRAVEQAALMRERVGIVEMHRRTGHVPDAFHIGPKILWLRDHKPEVFARTDVFLQPRDLVLHELTGVVATDPSHANATLLFDLAQSRWALDLFDVFNLEPTLLPKAIHSSTIAGELRAEIFSRTGIPRGTPVVIGAGDSQCAAFGAGVVEPGPISEMAGASSCLNSAVTRPLSDLRVTHFRHVVPDSYTTETGVNTSGAAISWAVSRLGYEAYEPFAADVNEFRTGIAATQAGLESTSVAPLFRPYLADGERDDPSARGALIGLSDRHSRAALAYSIVEGVAFAVASKIQLLHESGLPVTELRVAGGASRLAVAGQVKADVLGIPVLHLDVDAAGFGAAMLAGASIGATAEARGAIAKALNRATRIEPTGLTDFVGQRMEWFTRED